MRWMKQVCRPIFLSLTEITTEPVNMVDWNKWPYVNVVDGWRRRLFGIVNHDTSMKKRKCTDWVY